MATKVLKITGGQDDLAHIKEAATLVEAGGLVAFPTETVYGIACRARPDSVARLDAIKGRDTRKHYTLHIGEPEDYRKYIPKVGLRTAKLISRAWPGPLTLVFELTAAEQREQRDRISGQVFEALYKNDSIGIRCPDHTVGSQLLRLTRCPVVAPSANPAGAAPATDAEAVLSHLSDRIDLVLDSGPCKHKLSSTVARVGRRGVEVLREGVYSQAQLQALSEVTFLFVCTGNTCRSPMAEGLFRTHLAKKIGCGVDAVEKMGYKVLSASTMNMAGMPASTGALMACKLKGVDLGNHVSRHLTRALVEASDFIFCMTGSHCEQITFLSPHAESKCLLLAKDADIPDPIGQPQEYFNNCASIIESAVRTRLSEIVI